MSGLRRAVLLAALLLSGCGDEDEQWARRVTGGEPDRAEAAIRRHGCGTCHTIPGIPGADAVVGPPLTGFAERAYIAGRLPNSPESLILWIQDPHAVKPETAMPDMAVSEQEARDIAAYLFTLK